jgi:hypothetical protein
MIGAGDGVCQDDVYLTAQLVENFGESEGGTDGVAVRSRVGGEKETGMSPEGCQKSGDLGLRWRFRLGFMRDDLARVNCRGLEP